MAEKNTYMYIFLSFSVVKNLRLISSLINLKVDSLNITDVAN